MKLIDKGVVSSEISSTYFKYKHNAAFGYIVAPTANE